MMAGADGLFCVRCGAGIGPGAYFCPRCGTGIPVAPGGAETTVAIAHGGPAGADSIALLDALRQATLGDYEILAELGRGGMATVYLAHEVALGRKVAIKVLAPALLLMGEGMVERFKREARTAAALSHPHIIPIYAVRESERVLYFVMQYVQGRALDSIIRDVGPLPIPMVQTILAQVGDALSYAHRRGIIHRDIKPANIMLDDEGRAVVTDFGIAKVLQAEGLTVTGVTVGTPTYMSPEQCATLEVTGASDQYSLGVVAYEMVTGRLPFQGDTMMGVMYAHFNEPPRPVTELRPDCPADLAAAVMRMLEKEPARRWPSLDDVVTACGRPSHHDDPIRSQMITLAKTGGRGELLAQLKTPTSPIVLSKPLARPAAAAIPRARRVSGLWWTLTAVLIGVALRWVIPRLVSPPPPSPPTVSRPVAGRDTLVVPLRATPGARKPLPAPRATAARESLRVRPPATESASRAAGGVDAQRADSLVRPLRATALAAMSRAIEAGALPADLAKGDTVYRGAESRAGQGRLSAALGQLATAASLWTEAERLSRSRVARDTPRPRPTEPPARPLVTHPPASPRVEIETGITAYARALESRDLSEVRRVYPGLTPTQRDFWRQFFLEVRKLQAGLTVTALAVSGDTAQASVSAVYDYVNNTTGRIVRQTDAFRATFVQDSTGWRLTSIH
jgi:serine/threonine-protein kinase